MKLIITDIKNFALPVKGEHKIIKPDSMVKHCIGCFGCWIKTPGECVIKDGFHCTGWDMGKCEELIMISECLYGGFSSFVYPIWLSHSELVEIVYSNPDTNGGWSYRCYGNFDGVYVIFADKKFKTWEPKTTVDVVNGLTFIYPNENKLQVCAGGTFYSLNEAFEKKIISEAELNEVYHVYTMESQIKNEFLAKYGHEFPDMVAEDKEVIVKFEKISGDVYVAVIASKCFDNTKSRSETVNGITFTWEQQYDIHVYFHGEFLTLSEAYQRGLLTAEQLIEVHSSYTRSFGEMYGDPTVFNG